MDKYSFCCSSERWDKKNLKFHPNGTVSFNQQKIFEFQEELSNGSEDDLVVVPNIPMLVSSLILILRKYCSLNKGGG